MAKSSKLNVVEAFFNSVKDENTFNLNDESLYAEYCDTEIPVLNLALTGDINGGWEEGRTTVLAGPESSGKTLLSLWGIRNHFKKYPDNGVVYLIETEGRVAQSLVNQVPKEFRDRVIVKQISTMDELSTLLTGTIKPQLAKLKSENQDLRLMIIIDSIGNTGSEKENENAVKGELGKGDMGKPKQLRSLMRTIAVPLIGKYRINFIIINHIYDVVGGPVAYQEMGGGRGIKYLGNSIFFIKRINPKFKDKKEKEKKGASEENEKAKEDDASDSKILNLEITVKKSLSILKGTKIYLTFKNNSFYKYSDIFRLAGEFKLLKKKTGKLAKNSNGEQMWTYVTDKKELLNEENIYTLPFIKKNFMDELVQKVGAEFKSRYAFEIGDYDASSDDNDEDLDGTENEDNEKSLNKTEEDESVNNL